MEVYYRKYAKTFKYSFMRWREDRKFKKKRKQQAKNKPKPVYNPPKRTPEEQREIDLEMQRLYREYHIGPFAKFLRNRRDKKRAKEELAASLGEKKTESEAGRKVNKVISAIATVLLVIAAIFCGYVLIMNAQGKPVNVFGRYVMKVVTGSMEPSIHTGDYIVVKKTDVTELKTGDIITFYSDQEDVKGKLVTHRIAAINEDGSFETKGDANPIEDRVSAKPDKVLGRYTGKTRFFIWLNSFGSPRKLLAVLVIIPVALLALFEVRSVAKAGKQFKAEKQEEARQAKEQLMREKIEEEKRRLAEKEGSADEVKNDEPR